jgi:hypothetical protein
MTLRQRRDKRLLRIFAATVNAAVDGIVGSTAGLNIVTGGDWKRETATF